VVNQAKGKFSPWIHKENCNVTSAKSFIFFEQNSRIPLDMESIFVSLIVIHFLLHFFLVFLLSIVYCYEIYVYFRPVSHSSNCASVEQFILFVFLMLILSILFPFSI